MQKILTVISDRETVKIDISSILYVELVDRKTVIHIFSGKKYETYTPIDRIAPMLEDNGFIRVSRSCIVAASAIYRIGSRIRLINGEALDYSYRRKHEITERSRMTSWASSASFDQSGIPDTSEGYSLYYGGFDELPIAFTDIEMVFNEEHSAVDWLFRYVNPALEHLEKQPKEKLLNHSFRELFPNMDDKWLCAYARTALYGETLEIMDYSPEIDKYLKIICFPTFKGHCGCLLFDLADISLTTPSRSGRKTLDLYVNGFDFAAYSKSKQQKKPKN